MGNIVSEMIYDIPGYVATCLEPIVCNYLRILSKCSEARSELGNPLASPLSETKSVKPILTKLWDVSVMFGGMYEQEVLLTRRRAALVSQAALNILFGN